MSHGAQGASVTFDPEPRFIIQRAAGQKNNFPPGTEVTSANYHSTDYPQPQGPYTIRWAHSTAGEYQVQNASLNVEFDNTAGFEFGKIENGSFVKFPDKAGEEGITTAKIQSNPGELTYHVMLLANMLNSSPSRDFSSNIKTIELTELTQWYELLVHGKGSNVSSDDGRITLKFNTNDPDKPELTKYFRVYLRQVNLVNRGDLVAPVWKLEKKIIRPPHFESGDAYHIEKLRESKSPDAVQLYISDGTVKGSPEGKENDSADPQRIMYKFIKDKYVPEKYFVASNMKLAKYIVTLNTDANTYLGLNNEKLSATITLENYYDE